MRSTAAADVAIYDPHVVVCDPSRRKSTRSGGWSFPEQSAESTTSTPGKADSDALCVAADRPLR